MMKINVVDQKNEKVGEVTLDDAIFAAPVRKHLFWEVVNWQRARRRAGTQKVKTRAEVSGGGKKPWRQKGTGRARAGTTRAPHWVGGGIETRAPHWVGGGIVHGPSPRDFSFSMPKKKRKAALRSVLSLKARDGKLIVVDDLTFAETKTKFAIGVLNALQAPSALLVDATSRDEKTQSVVH